MVQWSSARVCQPSVPDSNPSYSLTICHSLISLPSGKRLPRLLPYCPQMTLTMLYASEAVVALSLAHSLHIRENVNI